MYLKMNHLKVLDHLHKNGRLYDLSEKFGKEQG